MSYPNRATSKAAHDVEYDRWIPEVQPRTCRAAPEIAYQPQGSKAAHNVEYERWIPEVQSLGSQTARSPKYGCRILKWKAELRPLVGEQHEFQDKCRLYFDHKQGRPTEGLYFCEHQGRLAVLINYENYKSRVPHNFDDCAVAERAIQSITATHSGNVISGNARFPVDGFLKSLMDV